MAVKLKFWKKGVGTKTETAGKEGAPAERKDFNIVGIVILMLVAHYVGFGKYAILGVLIYFFYRFVCQIRQIKKTGEYPKTEAWNQSVYFYGEKNAVKVMTLLIVFMGIVAIFVLIKVFSDPKFSN